MNADIEPVLEKKNKVDKRRSNVNNSALQKMKKNSGTQRNLTI